MSYFYQLIFIIEYLKTKLTYSHYEIKIKINLNIAINKRNRSLQEIHLKLFNIILLQQKTFNTQTGKYYVQY